MNIRILAGMLATGTLLGMSSAGATTLIDNFNDSQRVSAVPNPSLVSVSQVATTNAIGGYRDMEVSNDQGVTDGTELRVSGGLLSFSNIANASGTGVITYDGNDSPSTLNPFGLGGIDLQTNATLSKNFFFFDVFTADNLLDITIEAYDMFGGHSSYFETLTSGFDPKLYFNQFTAVGPAPAVDFHNIGALVFTVKSVFPDLDGSLNAISVSSVPVPAAGLLLLGGLGGLSAIGARRRKKDLTA